MKPPPASIIVLVQTSTDSFDKHIHIQYYVQTVVSKWVHIGVTVYPGASLNTKFVILWKCIKLTCFNMRERSTEVANGRFKNSSGTLLAICNFWSLWLLNMAQCTTDNRHYLLIKNNIILYNIYYFILINVSLNPKTFNHIMIVWYAKSLQTNQHNLKWT